MSAIKPITRKKMLWFGGLMFIMGYTLSIVTFLPAYLPEFFDVTILK